MTSAVESLKLEKLFVVYPGDRSYPLSERITAVGLSRLKEALAFEDG